jgi:hypothetical protein
MIDEGLANCRREIFALNQTEITEELSGMQVLGFSFFCSSDIKLTIALKVIFDGARIRLVSRWSKLSIGIGGQPDDDCSALMSGIRAQH